MGFKRLILNGHLLHLPPDIVDSIFDSIDVDRSGNVTFEELWPWFLHEAREYTRNNRKTPLRFTVGTILTPRERILIGSMKAR